MMDDSKAAGPKDPGGQETHGTALATNTPNAGKDTDAAVEWPDADRLVEACPGCDSAQINARETKTPTYYCNDCSATFETPHERPPWHKLHERETDFDATGLLAAGGTLYKTAGSASGGKAIHTDEECRGIPDVSTTNPVTHDGEFPLTWYPCQYCAADERPATATDGGGE